MNHKFCDTLQLASTDRVHFVRITMPCFSSMKIKYLNDFPKMYIRLGSSVVSIANCPSPAIHVNTVRNILIALALVRRFSVVPGIGRFVYIRLFLEYLKMRIIIRRLKTCPLNQLVDESLMLAMSLKRLVPPYHYKIVYSPNVLRMARQMMTSICVAIHSI